VMAFERQTNGLPSAPMPAENSYGAIARVTTIEAAIIPAPISIAC